jgi:predicted nucleotidyltransferase
MENSRNYSEEFKKVAIELTKKIRENFKDDILGISISGSLAYGSADEFSDIDLDLWLPEETYKKWIVECPLMDYLKEYSPNKETPTNISFLIRDLYKFDLTLLSTDRIKKEVWKIEQKANRMNSIILFDTNNIVKNLLNEKIKSEARIFNDKEKYSVTEPNPEEYYIFYISAYLNYHIPVAIARKRFEQAQLNLNWALNLLIELLWVKHIKLFPYMKSRWNILEEYLDKEQIELLREAMVMKDHSKEDIQRRRKVLRELFSKLGYKETKFFHEKLDLS